MLTPPQQKVITTTEGAVLIIAGPGTGKTFTIVKRIAHLVADMGVKMSEIMVVTFTEKAAHELLTRISDEFAALGLDVPCGVPSVAEREHGALSRRDPGHCGRVRGNLYGLP